MSDFESNKDELQNDDLVSEDYRIQSDATDIDSAPQPSKAKNTTFSKSLIEQIELIVITLAIIVLIFSFFGRTCRVSGDSMQPTLENKDTVFISNLFYTPEKEDIIVFHQTNFYADKFNEPIVKRVIGLPGDTVKIEHFEDHMIVTVISPNGTSTVLEEDYVQYVGAPDYYNSVTYVEEGTVFVLGDNRFNSADSRAKNIGLVDNRRILGKVVFRVTPISQFGLIK